MPASPRKISDPPVPLEAFWTRASIWAHSRLRPRNAPSDITKGPPTITTAVRARIYKTWSPRVLKEDRRGRGILLRSGWVTGPASARRGGPGPQHDGEPAVVALLFLRDGHLGFLH